MIAQPPFGERVRRWREHRRLSQLDLALQADVSTRHLSFLETGRAVPSREMVLRLAEHLDLPLRERNELLLSAGYAPAFSETPLEAPPMDAIRQALRQVLSGHEPYPALVVDRHWNLVEANRAVSIFTRDLPPDLLQPPVNVLRASLHPRGFAPRIVNLAEWRGHLLHRLRREIALTADGELSALYEELRAYPSQPAASALPEHSAVVAPLRLRSELGELAFFSMVASIGTPVDITVSELVIESFFPADQHTASALHAAFSARSSSVDDNRGAAQA
jgi:transcriptional regulator with XRE-family HTH domain